MKTVVAILCTAMLMLMSSPTNGQAPTSYQPPGVTFALTGLDIAPSPTVGASFVTVCDQDFTPFYNPTCPGTSGTVLCRATADAVLPGTAPGAPAGADAMWRDGNTGRVYIARAGVPFIDVYATTTSGGPWIQRHSYLTSFALNGPASSITVQRGTNRIVAAINNSLVPPQRRIDYIDPTTYQVAVTVTCTNVSSYDFVMTNCDGQIGVLLTGTDQNRYFTPALHKQRSF